jgi:flavin reductase (DIM6/NTAB) family NADH-FMN oxidoreductase RutF
VNAPVANGRSPTVSDEAAPDGAVRGEVARELYRKLAAGVTIVTASGTDGPTGLTATAVTSVSLSPPLLLVCIANESRTLAAVRHSGTFAAHLLRSGQRAHAERFAVNRLKGRAKFEDIGWRTVLGVPVLSGVLAWALCEAIDVRTYGDHAIVVGRLLDSSIGYGTPLLWHDGGYRALATTR